MNEQVSLNNKVLDALLVDYAAGALSQPLEILIETHLAMNPESAKTMQMLMQLGGILLEECEPVSLSEDALHEVMLAIADDVEHVEVDCGGRTQSKPLGSFKLTAAKLRCRIIEKQGRRRFALLILCTSLTLCILLVA